MSAWIVSKGHIDVLVNGLVQHGLIEPEAMNQTGQMLWQENHNSIGARYGDRHNDPKKAPRYSAETTEVEVDETHLAAAINCYDYQTCEHNEWPSTTSFHLMKRLLAAIPKGERGYSRGTDGFVKGSGSQNIPGDYLWGYDSLSQVIVKGVST